MAERLAVTVDDGSLIARLGGDEFVVVPPSPTQPDAAEALARFIESVADIIAEFGLAPESVCLEITENVVVSDLGAARSTLAGLKRVDVQLAIDDFGTGYSALSHLKSLPVDVLKIDRSLVAELGSNPDDLAIVRAIIALAGRSASSWSPRAWKPRRPQ